MSTCDLRLFEFPNLLPAPTARMHLPTQGSTRVLGRSPLALRTPTVRRLPFKHVLRVCRNGLLILWALSVLGLWLITGLGLALDIKA